MAENPLQAAQHAHNEVLKAEQQLKKARHKRAQAFADANKQGHSQAAIAEAVGLHEQTVRIEIKGLGQNND